MYNKTPVIGRGIVAAYDKTRMTAIVVPYDGSATLTDVACPFLRSDITNGAYSFTPPTVGSPCIYVKAGGETYILAIYTPVNLSGKNTAISPYGQSISRVPDAMTNADTLPGNTSSTNSLGSEESFTDTMKRIIMIPSKLSSIWNIVNCVWENVCTIFRLTAAGFDIKAECNSLDKTDTIIRVRRSVNENGGPSAITLVMGNTADVLSLAIDGSEILHIDGEKNVTINSANVVVKTNDVDWTAANIKIVANQVDMTECGAVKLP